ncbi:MULTISPECIES: hypothetical protein [Dietzia]|uniref:hypothetical protein n=1 Tax=Dietzia TaxID=37914 RepID=UPI000D087E78|nr:MULTISPECIES: hypothetical protein [Dietzia]AVM65110.1 hypothetical protein C3V38_12730 [Dietzia sp. oral taxon 368]MCT1710415.1 hypothetical protein [Dietzia cinnamea]MCT2275233.1 hypothetical protein [Dietzia cinnamea]
MSPAKFVAGNKNATGGDAATSSSTSGVRPTPTSQEEIVMPKSNPRLEWRTGYAHRGIEPVTETEMPYLLDGDDPLALRARASVVILGGAA